MSPGDDSSELDSDIRILVLGSIDATHSTNFKAAEDHRISAQVHFLVTCFAHSVPGGSTVDFFGQPELHGLLSARNRRTVG